MKLLKGLVLVPCALFLMFVLHACDSSTEVNKCGDISMSTKGTVICDLWGVVSVQGGEYKVKNNVWGATTGQCIDVDGTSFTVVSSEHNQPDSVASYPSIFKGITWGGESTANSGMPIRVGEVSSAPFSVSYGTNRPSGKYNLSVEAWIFPQGADEPFNGGSEIMMVLDYQGGMVAAGTLQGTFLGYDVYHAEIGWDFVTFVKTGRSSASGDFMDFINYAADKGWVDRNAYLNGFEAGMELMIGGAGLTLNSFSFDVNTGQQPQYYSLSLSPSSETSGSGSYTANTVVNIGYTGTRTFVRWSGDTQYVANVNSATTTVTMPASNVVLEAVTENSTVQKYTLTISEEGVVVSQNEYEAGDVVTISNTNPDFIQWTGDTQYLANVNSATTTLTMPARDISVNADIESNSSGDYVNISVPFTKDGAGEYWWKTSTTPSFVNSWNLDLLEINGVDLTNTWRSGGSLPAKQEGYYYIHYKALYAWSHFEIK